jgi:hypothetical protein
MRWVLYCPNQGCDFERKVSRLDGESRGEAIERIGRDHDDRDGHEVRGRRE